MGVIFALSRETEKKQRVRSASTIERDYSNKTIIGKLIEKIKNRVVKLPRVVQLFLLYFGLGILAGIGGVIFSYTEYYREERELKERQTCWAQIEENFTETEQDELKIYGEYYNMYNTNNKWKLRYAAFFAATTFTTTGFGLQAPVTVLGRTMVAIYGLPAIMIYGFVAKKIGLLCIHFIKTGSLKFMTEEKWMRRKLTIIGVILGTGFFLLAWLIQATSTEEGFGQGIEGKYSNSLYFLWTTTSTIGFGDVMMSGSHMILTGLTGIWLATTCGLMICFGTELGTAVIESQNLRTQHEGETDSANESSHVVQIIKLEKSVCET